MIHHIGARVKGRPPSHAGRSGQNAACGRRRNSLRASDRSSTKPAIAAPRQATSTPMPSDVRSALSSGTGDSAAIGVRPKVVGGPGHGRRRRNADRASRRSATRAPSWWSSARRSWTRCSSTPSWLGSSAVRASISSAPRAGLRRRPWSVRGRRGRRGAVGATVVPGRRATCRRVGGGGGGAGMMNWHVDEQDDTLGTPDPSAALSHASWRCSWGTPVAIARDRELGRGRECRARRIRVVVPSPGVDRVRRRRSRGRWDSSRFPDRSEEDEEIARPAALRRCSCRSIPMRSFTAVTSTRVIAVPATGSATSASVESFTPSFGIVMVPSAWIVAGVGAERLRSTTTGTPTSVRSTE